MRLPGGSLPSSDLNKNSYKRYDNRENAMKKKTKKDYKKRRRVGDLLRILILFVALSVLLYPTVSNYLYEKNSARVITSYDEKAVEYSEKEQKQMLEDARAYNEEMLENVELLDPFSTEKKEENQRYQSLLNVDGSGMMGYIRIPKIEVELPVYHGTSESVLQAGVGHMEGTSLPVGGESTHAVLTGHRGLPSKLLFTDLDEMEVRDIFYIKVLGETFAYQVDQILTVLPSETDALRIEQGKDYVTLVTCTPYAVNTHRLLVRGHRIPYEEAVQQVPDEVRREIPLAIRALIGAVIFLLVVFIIYQIRKRIKKKRSSK